MSGVEEYARVARAVMWCNSYDCRKRFESDDYRPTHTSMFEACRPAYDSGWRLFVGRRSQHAYCPDHGPTVKMRQLYPGPVA